ncbi:MAG: hypothetical protein WCR29_00030 [Bacteroidales bacterium]
MKKILFLIIASVCLSACGNNKTELKDNSTEQKSSQDDSFDKFKLSDEEREMFKNVFNAYIKFDKSDLSSLKRMDKLLFGDEFNLDRDKNIKDVELLSLNALKLLEKDKFQDIYNLLKDNKVKFYVHPANTIDNELSFHNVLIILYSMFYEKEEFLKASIELGNFSILHIEAVHKLNGEWSSNYPLILSDIIMLNENLGDIDNMIVNVEKLCQYNEDINKGRNNEPYRESLKLLRDLFEKTNNKAKVDSCNIILKKLN